MLPDVPTLRELGFPFDVEGPIGLAGPKNMDPKVVATLHDAFKKTLDDPRVLETLTKMELVPAYKNGADYKKMLAENMEIERGILTELGMVRKD
ncbi:MAG: tripartite tricarboxylate transporter substrate-binding protein [Xanthobacteraceae bacterium]